MNSWINRARVQSTLSRPFICGYSDILSINHLGIGKSVTVSGDVCIDFKMGNHTTYHSSKGQMNVEPGGGAPVELRGDDLRLEDVRGGDHGDDEDEGADVADLGPNSI